MTITQDWRTMEPGDEMNALVAEALGSEVEGGENGWLYEVDPNDGHCRPLPRYAADSTWALMIVRRTSRMGWRWTLQQHDDEYGALVWTALVRFKDYRPQSDDDFGHIRTERSASLPFVICRAVLAAVEAQARPESHVRSQRDDWE
jgi:hypothetical protein